MNEKEKTNFEKLNQRQTVILTLIAVVTLLLVVVGATYAFFASQNTGKKDTNINAESGTVDVLTFESGVEINIKANLSNFAAGMSSVSQTTNPKATLRANDATNKAEEEYNVYLVIDENGLIYTNEEAKTPELLLKVKAPDGSEIKNIPGLKYYENVDGQEGVSGFDITNKENAFGIYEGYKIVVGEEDEGVKVDTWEVTVTLVNFKTGNQNDNTGRNFHGRIVMTKGTEDIYKLAHINTVNTKQSLDSITATLDITDGTKGITEYWFGIESKGEVMATSTEDEFNDYHKSETGATYTFNGLKDNNNYVIHSYTVDEEGFKSNVYETDVVATDKSPKIINAEITEIGYDTIKVKVIKAEKGKDEIENYKFQIETNGEVIEDKTITKAETTHTFTGLTELTQYKIIINAIESNGNKSPNYELSESTKYIPIGIFCQNETVDCWINNNAYSSRSPMMKFGHKIDKIIYPMSMYYYGDDPNNYICLDSKDGGDCELDNLYRIIGLFANKENKYEWKIIKADFVDKDQIGMTIDKNIDENDLINYQGKMDKTKLFYTTLYQSADSVGYTPSFEMFYSTLINKNPYLQNIIVEHENYTGENKISNWESFGSFDTIPNLNDLYISEYIISNKKTRNSYESIMYLSDFIYIYMASKGYNTNDNWLYLGVKEYTLDIYYSSYAAYIKSFTSLSDSYQLPYLGALARPVFYLSNATKLKSGLGTIDSPFRVGL